MDLLDCCDICGEDHSTEFCPELGLNVSLAELDQLSTRARLTLPKSLHVVDNGNGLVGVVAKQKIPAKTQFGPFEAKRTTHIFDDFGFFTLKLICKDGLTVCLDTTDENECNWMCLVRAAVSNESQNCMAYQLGTNIFFSTTKDVDIREELQVWYAPHFARKLGKPSEPDGETKVLLGHRIEPLVPDIFGDSEGAAGQTDGPSHDQSPKQTSDSSEPVRGEIKKAFYCPRCGNTFGSQSSMVQHLREHVIAGTLKSDGKRRGRGRPRSRPFKVSDVPKRRPGRPRKNPLTNNGQTADSKVTIAEPLKGKKRKHDDDQGAETEEMDYEKKGKCDDGQEDETEEMDYEESEDGEVAADNNSLSDVDEVDKDYSPLKELSSSKRRVQPRRARKGKNSWLCTDYVVIKTAHNSSVEGQQESINEEMENDSKIVPNKSKQNNNTFAANTGVKRGRGRPRKIKDLVASVPVVVEIVNDAIFEETNDGMNEVNETKADAIITESGADNEDKLVTDTNDKEPAEPELEVTNKTVNMTDEHQKENDNDAEPDSEQAVTEEGTKDPESLGSVDIVVMVEESVEKYVCVFCQEKFDNREVAVTHCMSHKDLADEDNEEASEAGSKELGFPCDICQQAFRTAQYLYRHMVMHTDVYSCVTCKKTFSRKDSLQKHILKCCPEFAANYKIYSCKVCTRVFSTRTGYQKHMKKCQSVQCENCNKIFSSQEDCSKHKCSRDESDDTTPGRFACGICPKSFQSLYYLKQHTLLHQSLHSCDKCGKTLPTQDDLEEHKALCQTIESIKQVGSDTCDKCGDLFTNVKLFREHYMSHTHPYQCEKCLRRFVKIGTLTVHDCQQIVSEEFSCKDCGKGFKNQMNLDRHIKELGCMRYECSECGEHFHMKAHAKNHFCNGKVDSEAKIINISEEKEICPTCGKSFSTKSNLTKHMLLHGEKMHTCPHCQKKFHLDVYLKDHISCVHYNICKYQCTHCGKMLKSKTGLIAHNKLFHSTTLELHPCPKCGKLFKQKGNLRTHMFSHSTERKFSCSECMRTFKYPDQLSRHRLEHRIKDKISCQQCDKTFYREYELKKHIHTYHSGYMYVCAICSSRCGHKHTLIRHFKRKHADDFKLLFSQDGYIDSMLKHVNEIFPNSGGIESESIILQSTIPAEDAQQQVGQTTEMLSRDAAEALHSLAMGTVTAKQYQILRDKGLFKDSLPLQTSGDQVTMVTDQSVIVSEEGKMIQPQEVLQHEQIITDGLTNIATVSMDTTMGMVQNKDGTINISGLQGIPQNIEGLETAEGQIVILQIVDPEGQEMSGLMQGEIIHQIQTGEAIQASQNENEEIDEEVVDEETTTLTISEDNSVVTEMAEKETVNEHEQREIIDIQLPSGTSLQNGVIMPVNKGLEVVLEKTSTDSDTMQVGNYMTVKQGEETLMQEREIIQVHQDGEVIRMLQGGEVVHIPQQNVMEIQEAVSAGEQGGELIPSIVQDELLD